MMSHTLDYPLALAHVQLGGPPRFDTLHGLPIGVDPPRWLPSPYQLPPSPSRMRPPAPGSTGSPSPLP